MFFLSWTNQNRLFRCFLEQYSVTTQFSLVVPFEVPTGIHFFDFPFPKRGTESCSVQQNRAGGTDTEQDFPQRFRGKESTPGQGNKETLKKGDIFGKKIGAGGKILRDNFAVHCFLLRDIVPTRFFK